MILKLVQKVGEFVWSRDPKTGEQGYKPVVRTFENFKANIVKTITETGLVIQSTDDHLFFTQENSWIEAKNLKPGDNFVDASGKLTKIKSVEQFKDPQPVYNLEVADWHTYFVVDEQNPDGVWVHNLCIGDISRRINSLYGKVSDGVFNRLIHVIMGESNNLEKGLHSPEALIEYFKKDKDGISKIRIKRVRDDVEIPQGDIDELKKAIDNGDVLKYKDPNRVPSRSGWSADKTVFPNDWSIEDIAKAGDDIFKNPASKTAVGDIEYLEGTFKGKDIVVEVYNGNPISWYPKKL
ncbi:MAG: hypothetical protein OHK0017_13930 [Patescibacteria group bacterium]